MNVISAEFVKSSSAMEQCPADGFAEYAFIGRSNVGKSSLINMLVNKKNMAKTSGTPGKTRLINHFQVNSDKGKWNLVDLPGYGYAKISKDERAKWEIMIREYLVKRETLICTFVLIDVRIKPQKLDIEFCLQLAGDGVPFALVFTKADKEKPGAVERSVEEFCEKLLEHFDDLPNLFVTSAATRLGREKVLSFIESTMHDNI